MSEVPFAQQGALLVASARAEILEVPVELDFESSSSVDIVVEFLNSGLSIFGRAELNNAVTFGSAVRKHDLCLFNASNGLEELDEIFIGSRPG